MISITEALAVLKENLPAPSVEERPLEEALGLSLADDLLAPEPSPRYTNSAMDGYAVCWEDVRQSTPSRPTRLLIVGESRAGAPLADPVGNGQAARISTGAMLPEGADTVIRVEDAGEEGEMALVRAAKRQGQDVRRRGEEFGPGDLLLRRGAQVLAPQAALLAAVGIERVRVFRPCAVALLVTGSELMAAGGAIANHQIRDSNTIMLSAAARQAGARLVSARRVVDDQRATVEAIAEAQAELILCSGGVSVGRHDHVKAAAEENGFTPLFWKVRQRPGKPLYLARRGGTLLFGLPGNPVSAFMCFVHYVRPAIAALSGQPFAWPTTRALAGEEMANPGQRSALLRVRRLANSASGDCLVASAERQGSHMLTSLTGAFGYLMLEPEQRVAPGQVVEVYLF